MRSACTHTRADGGVAPVCVRRPLQACFGRAQDRYHTHRHLRSRPVLRPLLCAVAAAMAGGRAGAEQPSFILIYERSE